MNSFSVLACALLALTVPALAGNVWPQQNFDATQSRHSTLAGPTSTGGMTIQCQSGPLPNGAVPLSMIVSSDNWAYVKSFDPLLGVNVLSAYEVPSGCGSASWSTAGINGPRSILDAVLSPDEKTLIYILDKNFLWAPSMLVGVDPHSGAELWTVNSTARFDSRLFVFNNQVWALDQGSKTILGLNPDTGAVVTETAIADGASDGIANRYSLLALTADPSGAGRTNAFVHRNGLDALYVSTANGSVLWQQSDSRKQWMVSAGMNAVFSLDTAMLQQYTLSTGEENSSGGWSRRYSGMAAINSNPPLVASVVQWSSGITMVEGGAQAVSITWQYKTQELASSASSMPEPVRWGVAGRRLGDDDGGGSSADCFPLSGSSIVVDANNMLYVLYHNGNTALLLDAVNGATGTPEWSYEVPLSGGGVDGGANVELLLGANNSFWILHSKLGFLYLH